MLAQATELTVTQQSLSSLQQRQTISENHVEELEKQQEGKGVFCLFFLNVFYDLCVEL